MHTKKNPKPIDAPHRMKTYFNAVHATGDLILPKVFKQTGTIKQYRPRSDTTESGVWSGYTLFATYPAFLDTSNCSEMNMFQF